MLRSCLVFSRTSLQLARCASWLLLALSLTMLGFGCTTIFDEGTHTLDVCTPAATKCDAMGNVLVCADGQTFTKQTACPYACLNGACAGTCVPGTKQCSGGEPQTCDQTGTWQTGTCPSGETCSAGTCSGGCYITGSLYAAGTLNPGNPCQSCQPKTSTTIWTNVAVGMACGSGEVCNAGTCAMGCWIGGAVYPPNMANPNDPCQTCDPTSTTMAWSNLKDGVACGNGQLCSGGQCGTQCFIGGSVYPTGMADPTNPCVSCQPAVSTSAWTNLSSGTACGAGQVCNTGTCAAGCFVGGVVYAAATPDPANACASCQPGTSTTAWTNVADGTSCATGQICSSGSCVAACDIGATVYMSGVAEPSNPCATCAPATSTTSWTTTAGGTVCGSACVDLQKDTQNCGKCGRACPSGGTCSSGVCVNVYAYTGSDQTYTVPSASCGTLTLEVWAAGGGGNQETFAGYVGGGGGYTEGVLPATAGQVLTLIVGQGGATALGSTYGGGGTGATGVSCTTYTGQGGGRSAVRIGGTEQLTAGGGGGSGCNDNAGGPGGGLQGGGGFSGNPPSPTGGSQTAGGTGSVPGTNDGKSFQGGAGLSGGAGGGGGYYGGGGNGGGGTLFGSGGGGSGFCAAGLLCTTTAATGATGAHQTGDWVAGVGNGGTSATNTLGGNGLIVVRCGN